MTTSTEERAAPLTTRAKEILTATLDAFQSADELGGCESVDEYTALCDALVREIQDRRAAAVVMNLEPDFIEGDECVEPVYRTEARLDARDRARDVAKEL